MFEKYDVCDHWDLKYIHLIVLECSSLDLATYLAISNEEIDVVDSFGRTALMWAAWRGDDTSFSTLLQFGANSQASSFDGNSVLLYATYGGSKACLELLVGAGADVNHTSHSLVTTAMVRPRIGDNLAVATVRVVRGASIEASRQQRFTPLYVAALTDQVESLVYLLDCGATTDVASWDCSTPLSVAISLNNHRVVEELIKRNSDLEALSGSKKSYLTNVAMFGDERMMQLFMNVRPVIDINLRDVQGRTAKDCLWERLHSTGPTDLEKQRLATAFQQLIDICSEEYQKAQRSLWDTQGIDKNHEHHLEIFYDAVEDNGSQDSEKWSGALQA